MIKRPKYEVFQENQGQRQNDYRLGWYWRLVGGNGECQCVSEAYTTKSNARRGARDARRNSWIAKIVDV